MHSVRSASDSTFTAKSLRRKSTGRCVGRRRYVRSLAVRHLVHKLLDLLYPPTCCACDDPAPQPGFCIRCSTRLRFLRPPLCSLCGTPFETRDSLNHLCSQCLSSPPTYHWARAALAYDSSQPSHPLVRAIQHYKYDRDVSLAPALTRLLLQNLPAEAAPEVIVPVPLHPERLRWRGFNQALLLARGVAQHLHCGVATRALRRTRPTTPQVGLGESERRRNVRGAFAVHDPAALAGRAVLLIDDVLTTGATVNECSRSLLRAGASSVQVLTLARGVLA